MLGGRYSAVQQHLDKLQALKLGSGVTDGRTIGLRQIRQVSL